MVNSWIVDCVRFMIWPCFLLLIWGIRSFEKTRMSKKLPEDLKNMYWSKSTKWNEKLSVKTYNIDDDLCKVFGASIIICIGLLICYGINEDAFLAPMDWFWGDILWKILELNVGLMTIISLVVVFKKDYYLVITVRDVLILYDMPNMIVKEMIASIELVLFVFIYNIAGTCMSDPIKILTMLMFVSLMILCGAYTMVLIGKTIKLCLNDERKELEAFKCLRYRIANGYQLKECDKVPICAVEKIASYLTLQIKSKSNYLKNKNGRLKGVHYGSIMLPGSEHTQYYEESNLQGMVTVTLATIIGLTMCISTECSTSDRIGKIALFVVACISICVLVLGLLKGIWNMSANSNCYWTLEYEVNNGEPRKEVHAAYSLNPKERKRFDAIASIEDLMGLYKALLYDKDGQQYTYVIFDQVKEKLGDEEYQIVRDTIIFLLCYLNYEKVYAEIRQEKQGRIDLFAYLKDMIAVDEINREIERRENKLYLELKKYFKDITEEAVEYQLANSILMHVYKEAEYVNGRMNPEKLRNYRFESFFELCKSRNGT